MTFRDATDWISTIARGINAAQALHAVGLERRKGAYAHVLPAIAIFGAGIAVGAGLCLLLAPETTTKIKHELGKRAQDVKDGITSAGKSIPEGGTATRHGSHASS